MPVRIDSDVYLTATEASREVGVSRPTFYTNVQPHIRQYELPGRKYLFYKLSELQPFKVVREVTSEVKPIEPRKPRKKPAKRKGRKKIVQPPRAEESVQEESQP